jgi:hypothetical protein
MRRGRTRGRRTSGGNAEEEGRKSMLCNLLILLCLTRSRSLKRFGMGKRVLGPQTQRKQLPLHPSSFLPWSFPPLGMMKGSRRHSWEAVAWRIPLDPGRPAQPAAVPVPKPPSLSILLEEKKQGSLRLSAGLTPSPSSWGS